MLGPVVLTDSPSRKFGISMYDVNASSTRKYLDYVITKRDALQLIYDIAKQEHQKVSQKSTRTGRPAIIAMVKGRFKQIYSRERRRAKILFFNEARSNKLSTSTAMSSTTCRHICNQWSEFHVTSALFPMVTAGGQ